MRVVSKGRWKEDPVCDSAILQDTVIALRGHDLVPQGVRATKDIDFLVEASPEDRTDFGLYGIGEGSWPV